MEKEKYLDSCVYDLEKSKEIIGIILVTLVTYFTPLFVPKLLNMLGSNSYLAVHSQYVVGTIVNVCLIWAALNIKGMKKILGVVTLPSLSAITSGLIFKSASIYTVYMIPFIWIGNFLFIYMYKRLFVSKKISYLFSSILAIIVKVSIIFLGFILLSKLLNIIPSSGKIFNMLSMNMGINQLITACIASSLSYILLKIEKVRYEKL